MKGDKDLELVWKATLESCKETQRKTIRNIWFHLVLIVSHTTFLLYQFFT